MEVHTTKNGIPKFAMDDVEIVLDELCSGYDKATECRMRKELFDHYQSAFDDAVGDGWIEEVAHKKVLQDLGWETTLMVGGVCKGMGWWGQGVARYVAYKRNIFPAWQKKMNYLAFFVSMLIAIPIISFDTYNGQLFEAVVFPVGLCFIFTLGLVNQRNKMKALSKQPPITLPILKQRMRRTTLLNYAISIFIVVEFSAFFLLLDDINAFLIPAFFMTITILQFYFLWVIPFNRFMQSWNTYCKEHRIF